MQHDQAKAELIRGASSFGDAEPTAPDEPETVYKDRAIAAIVIAGTVSEHFTPADGGDGGATVEEPSE